MIEINIKPFELFSNYELYKILQLRAEIFVVEQNCVYNDLDDLDLEGMHLIGLKNNNIIGYARILPSGTRFEMASIGRLVVDSNNRNNFYGQKIMEQAIQFIQKEWGNQQIKISAQKYLEKFYSNLGFETVSKEYLEDGIPHIGMVLKKIAF